jgi:ABC-type transport system substrate-binding protein
MALSRRTFLGLVLPAIAGCRGGAGLSPPPFRPAGSPVPRRGGTLTFSIPDDISSLDPAAGVTTSDYGAHGLLFDTFLDYAPARAKDPIELVPQLAERWSCSSDARTYTFHLRPGAVFSNGEPVLAEDFVFALDRLLSPEVNAPLAWLFRGVTGAADRLDGKSPRVAGLSAPGPSTLEIRLDQPDLSFAHLLALRCTTPLKKAHVEAAGPKLRDTVLGTGPFVLREWREGQRITYDRNPRYWNPERPYLDRIHTDLFIPDDTAAYKLLRGEVDTLYQLGSDTFLRFSESPAWRPYVTATGVINTFALTMNTRRPPFSDRRVRQAVNYAINKDDLARLFNGRMTPANGYLPPGMPGHDPHRKPYPHDPAKARALLAEAGLASGVDVPLSGVKSPDTDTYYQSIQADLAAVGIRARIDYLTYPSFYAALSKGDILLAESSWWMDFPDPWNFLEERFHSKMTGTNDSFYASPEVDRLLDEARHEPARDRRLSLYHQAEDLIFDDCPNAFLGFFRLAEVVAPHVAGYALHPVRLRSYRDTWLDLPPELSR